MMLWYVARAAGIVAVIALTAATALGSVSSGRAPAGDAQTVDRRYLVQMAHRSAALIGLFALATHVVLLVSDRYVDVSVGGVLVPFTAGYRPLALAAGTLGAYGILAAAVSGAVRGRLASSAASARVWRPVHVLAYLGWVLSMAHGVFAGSDTGAPWTSAIYAAIGVVVAGALVVRLSARITSSRTPLSLARALPGRKS